MLYEDLLTRISKSGPGYRWTITILVAFLSMKSAFDMFVLNLATARVPYHCAQAIVDNEVLPLANVAANLSAGSNFSAFDYTCRKPRFSRQADGTFRPVNTAGTAGNVSGSAGNDPELCSSWTFMPDPPERWTMLIEYQMVCDRSYLSDRMQTVMQLGICLSTIFGPLGDVIGRKPLLIAFCYLDLASNIGVIFVRSLTLQMVLRFFMGFGAPAVLIGVILITELVAEEYRGVHGNLIWILWVIGYSSSSAISYFILNWRIQMVAVVIVIGIGYAFYIPLLPESPRWLLTRGKTQRAKRVLKEVCKYSGCKEILGNFNFESNELVDASRGSEEGEQSCLFKLIPRENLCRLEYFVTLGVVSFNFFTVAFVYFALSFQRDFITKNPYLNVLISGVLELPAYIAAWQLTNRAGRRNSTLGTMGFCGLGLLILPYIPTNPNISFQGSSILAIAVKFSVTVAFSVLAVYGSEVLPTKVRSCSFFFACFLMRSSQILAPELGGALASFYVHLPYLLYGVICVLASLSVLLLPETKDKPMPNTVAEMEPVGCPCCAAAGQTPAGARQRRSGSDVSADGAEELKSLAV